MKKILGFILCMGIFLAGSTALYGSPPACECAQYEMVADVGHVEYAPVNFETLTRISHSAAEQTSAEYAERIAEITDTSDIWPSVAEIPSNAAGGKLATRRIDTDHRWCRHSNARVQTCKIYRPGWSRKVCEV